MDIDYAVFILYIRLVYPVVLVTSSLQSISSTSSMSLKYPGSIYSDSETHIRLRPL